MSDDRVERIARAIDPEAWKQRDEDLQRREEWDAGIKFGWGKMTFERWANRSVRKSLETARAVFRTLDPSIESLQAEVERIIERAAQIAESHATCGCNGKHGSCLVDDAPKAIAAEIRALAAKEQTRDR